ncbi:MAG: hypothetical protein JSS66_03360 [Armatimonadetes bacterium]|nr:hypothetical protein [Armatimonadota bacterium]
MKLGRYSAVKFNSLLLCALVSTGCGPKAVSNKLDVQRQVPPESRVREPQAERTTRVGGKYWAVHFFGNDENAALMNFLDYGIIPVILGDDKTVRYGGRYKAWKDTWSFSGDIVTIARKGGAWTLKVTEHGDLLVSDPPVEFGVPDNRVRLMRDDPSLHDRYLGRYKRISEAMTQVPAAIEIRKGDWTAPEPGYAKRPWLAAGPYIVLVGPEPSNAMADYESLILRPDQDGKRLSQNLSGYQAVYGKDMSVIYERIP